MSDGDERRKGDFSSRTVPRHLARGAAGFGALAGSVLLLPLLGLWSLLLAPVGLLALRGCPMCWAVGLAQTLSRGRLRRRCGDDGRCELAISSSGSGSGKGDDGGRRA
ncbi:hypothetical protein AB0G74_29835 [Streptomyces sp. NPDC020875]|uniref:hypothetical protein n=1 Tax=Streptomyces sp. NPDC020875 TaxID=3154898 RepID=UPI00340B3E05